MTQTYVKINSLVEVCDKWATSSNGQTIALYRSVKSTTGPYRPIIIIGGVHGDEPEGVWLSEHCLEWLKRTPVPLPWYLITCINPEGFKVNERTNSNGVDLNRNFPSADWSDKYEKPRYFPGPRPNSEPEVQALVNLFNETQPQLIIHCHSWNPCVVYTGQPARKDSNRLAAASKYEARPDIGYPTPGSLGNYAWNELSIPVICIEEAEKTPKNQIWTHFQQGFEEIFKDVEPRI